MFGRRPPEGQRLRTHRSVPRIATPWPWEVVGVPVVSSVNRLRGTIVYWVRLALLTVFGPATLDDEHDPIVQLKREHQRQRGAEGRPPGPRSQVGRESSTN
jgi:hypothetical protein